MANKTAKYKKVMQPCYCEPRLAELCRIFSKEKGSSHPNCGSASEIFRVGAKKYLLQLKPYLKNTEKSIDWSEAI